MARIAGINIPDNKQIGVALTYVYGLGLSSAGKILQEAKINSSILASEMKPEQINQIREIIEKKYKIEGDLRREIITSIKRLKDIGCWRGARHIKALPVRGQRTKTNNRTVRGNVRRTVSSGKRAAPAPK